jgi:hypothetical protein
MPQPLVAALEAILAMASQVEGDFWDSPIFARDTWKELMLGLRIGLGLGGALLLMAWIRARRLGVAPRERTARRIGIFLTATAFLCYFDFFNPNVRYKEYYHRHEFFHYYMGSKYARGLGYTRIYECTAVAEVELGRRDDVAGRELRDLHDSLIKPVTSSYVLTDPEQCKKHFTPEKWESFKKDVVWFEESSRGGYWRDMQKDHGYNPPPVWTMTGMVIGNLGSASDGFFKLLSGIDIALNLGMVLMFGWAFGWRIMAIATAFWAASVPSEFYWTGGAFLRQDWLFLLVAAVCLAKKRKFGLAGAALTWSALLRIFPVLLFIGWVLAIGLYLLKKRTLHPDHKRLIAGCAIATAVLVPGSMIAAGAGSYPEFFKNITSRQEAGATNRMGLETMIVHDWDRRMRFLRDDNLHDPFEVWKRERSARFSRLKPVFFAVALGVFAWTLWALRRTKLLWAAVPIGLPLIVTLTDPACYYYSAFIVAAVLAQQRPQLGPVMLAVGGASQLLGSMAKPPKYQGFYWIDDLYAAQAWLFFFFGILILYIYSRPFSMARLRAWWQGEPEPKRPRVPRELERGGL